MSEQVLVIAGCSLEFTPVVRSYVEYLKSNNVEVEVVEYLAGHRSLFVGRSVKALFARRRYVKIVFVNYQSLPLLFLVSNRKSSRLIYWKLESYRAFDNWSLALKLQLIEWTLPRSRVALVLPNRHREQVQSPKFESVSILPNAPLRPYRKSIALDETPRSLPWKLLIYGNMANADSIYLNDWVEFCGQNVDFRLSVFGKSGAARDGVVYHSKMEHQALMRVMLSSNFDYSIVGYRSSNSNTHLAAPNKLIESLSCGIPVIGNSRNPFVAEIVKEYDCGICVDFEEITTQRLNLSIADAERHRINSLRAARDLCLETRVKITPLAFRS